MDRMRQTAGRALGDAVFAGQFPGGSMYKPVSHSHCRTDVCWIAPLSSGPLSQWNSATLPSCPTNVCTPPLATRSPLPADVYAVLTLSMTQPMHELSFNVVVAPRAFAMVTELPAIAFTWNWPLVISATCRSTSARSPLCTASANEPWSP